jgi:glucose/arabinose dehydrogenase
MLLLVLSGGAALCAFALDCGLRGSPSYATYERGTLRLQPGLRDEIVLSGLRMPTTFALLPDGRILVGEKNGVIRIARDGTLLSRPFLDMRARVNDVDIRGLLAVRASPDFERSSLVYALYVHEDGGPVDGPKSVRVISVRAAGNEALLGSERVVLGTVGGDACRGRGTARDCIPADHLAGGDIAFAPDGTLFVATGDGESGGEATPLALRSQNVDSLAGKVLHVTPGGRGLPENPFWNGDPDANRSKVWAYGLRNPFRLALRPGSNTPYVGDVGWHLWEEIDVAARGTNGGWPCYEGRTRTPGYSAMPACRALYARGLEAVEPPLVAYPRAVAVTIVGGVFCTDAGCPGRRRDAYLYADFGRSWLRSLRVDAADKLVPGSVLTIAQGVTGPVDIQVAPGGAIYYLSLAGELHRLRGEQP